ncbi:MAG: hypothetical protein M1831_006370 [Alyxoria varia]|nr:MAG: hypothetical protein M1831_006370 [Alyxoria varia]
MSEPHKVFSRPDVEQLIADGRTIIIVDGYVLKLDCWLKFHPGGDKAILHMVGRDATDEVNALHSYAAREYMSKFRIGKIEGHWKNFVPPIQGGSFRNWSSEKSAEENNNASDRSSGYSSLESSDCDSPLFEDSVLRQRKPYDQRPGSSSSATSVSSLGLENASDGLKDHQSIQSMTRDQIEFDLKKYPSLEPEKQHDIVQKYRELNEKLKARDLYRCNYWNYAIECCRYAAFFSLSLLFLHWGWYGTSGLFLGMFWHQLVFSAHDAGHMGITHNFTIDTMIGIFIADFLGGLSLGWWKKSHNVHHIVTNRPEHDPDIELMPFFSLSHRFFDSLRSTYYDRVMDYDWFAKIAVQYQHYMYYPILTMGRFNLYRLSWEYLLLGLGPRKGAAWWHRWFEVAGQVFFWTWFGYGIVYKSIPTWWARFVFIMVSHMVTAPLHVQITLSHFAMSTADLGADESFPQKMLRTTMDVDCPEWLDFIHGGLQFQAIHHLYPRMPRHNLRKAQKLVQEFCNDVDIPYALYGFVDGNKEVIGRLGDIGKQAAILAECQRSVAAKPFDHH